MFTAFLSGFILSFGLIIPLGMQNIFIFNQGATQKHLAHALPSVITAFICDVILIVSAVLGISMVVISVPMLKNIISCSGIIFLLYMARLNWKVSIGVKEEVIPLSFSQQICFSLSTSLLNPHALLDCIAVLGTNSLHFLGMEKLFYSLGCTLVSFVWFISLATAGHCLKKIDSSGCKQVIVNKVSALIMGMTAVYLIFMLIK